MRTDALETPLEACAGTRITVSAEIDAYLRRLAGVAPDCRLDTWGHSAGGRPLTALSCGRHAPGVPHVLLVGSHHGGSEPAGGEALLALARDLVAGALAPLRTRFGFTVLPNANPDGRDLDSSRNAAGVNLNRDYVALSQPESRAIDAALRRLRPTVSLDAHESAALKRRTLWREGYLTEFEVQCEAANHPALRGALREALATLLPDWMARIAAGGLSATRYIREVHSTRQPLTHGGITLRGFRNKAGLRGVLSFLLETRLDPKQGHYPSFRNIVARTARQLLCQRAFLALLDAHYAVLPVAGGHASSSTPATLVLGADYVAPVPGATVDLPLRRVADDQVVCLPFADRRHLRAHPPLPVPRAYRVAACQELVAELLARHGLDSGRLGAPRPPGARAVPLFRPVTTTRGLPVLPAATLEIPTGQHDGLLVPLLLEPASSCRAARHDEFRALGALATLARIYRVY